MALASAVASDATYRPVRTSAEKIQQVETYLRSRWPSLEQTDDEREIFLRSLTRLTQQPADDPEVIRHAEEDLACWIVSDELPYHIIEWAAMADGDLFHKKY